MPDHSLLDKIRQAGEFHITDALSGKRVAKTPAQFSNLLHATAWGYESLWRGRSIGILSGEKFSLQDEADLLCEWLSPTTGEIILDSGCSTAYYARSLAGCSPNSEIIAVDYSMPMLIHAQKLARKENRAIHLLRADAENLPLVAHCMDAICCGGTLNEFHSPQQALSEMYRVLKPGGRLFLMFLTRSTKFTGNFFQGIARTGGISFWSIAEAEKILRESGFASKKVKQFGVVRFELLEK